MRFRTKLMLMGVVPVAVIVVGVGLVSWFRADWRPIVTILAFYAAVHSACLGLARIDQRQRQRRRSELR